MSDIKHATFIQRPTVDYPEVSKDYPHFSVVYKKPARRLNYSTIAAIITVAIYLISWIIFR